MLADILAVSSTEESSTDWLLIIGVVLLAGAGYAGFRWWKAKEKRKHMLTAETLSVAELTAMAEAANQAAGPGSFRYRCEVVGAAVPHESGVLKAQMSDTPCVWHRHTVTRRYWEMRRDSKGNRRRQERTEQVAHMSSDMHFRVQDQTGTLAIDPSDGRPDGAQKVMDRFEKDDGKRDRTNIKIGNFSMSLPSSREGGTIGYTYEEWVLKPKSRLYVLGEVTDSTGELTIGKPADGPFIISTKSEEQMHEEAAKQMRLMSVGAPVAAGVGAILLVVSLFT